MAEGHREPVHPGARGRWQVPGTRSQGRPLAGLDAGGGRAAAWLLAAAALAAVLAWAFWRAARPAGDPSAVFPLDDPYIYLVYARNTAAGHLFAYNPSDGPSSGATSTLWTLLLAAGYRLGLARVRPPGAAAPMALVLGLAAACTAGYMAAFAAACRAAAGRQQAGLAGCLLCAAATVCYGRFAWGAFSGLEVPLSALGVALFGLALSARGGPAPALLATLLTLVRPDLGAAALPAVALWGAEAAIAGEGGPANRHGIGRVAPLLWALLPAVALAAFVLFWRGATGEPSTNGTLVKTLFYAPGETVGALVRHVPAWLGRNALQLLSWRGRLHPWSLALAAAALPGLARRAGRALWLFAAAGLALEGAAFGPGLGALQHGRYDLPFLLALELAGALGWATLARAMRVPLWPAGVALLALAAPTLPPALAAYARDSLQIRGQQIAASTYIAAHLPPTAVVMLNDAGAMNYFGGRYTVDVEGLGSNGFALPMRAGTGAVYEHLVDYFQEHPRLAARPLYFAVYPGWFPGLRAVFGTCPAQFTVQDPTILGGPTAVLCEAGLPVAPEPGFRVADLGQDARYAYTASPPGGTWLLRLPDAGGQDVVGSGRSVVGPESFTVPATPGRPLAVTAVTTELQPVALRVLADGRSVGTWDWPASPGAWETLRFAIPGAAIAGRQVRITLEGPGRLTSDYRWTEG